MADAIDRDGGFRDIGGDDDFAHWIRREGKILLFRRQVAVQRNERQPFVRMSRLQSADRRIDFSHARHEHQDVSRFAGVHDSFHNVRRLFGHGPLVVISRIADFDGETLAF